jgi:hypothetical protein
MFSAFPFSLITKIIFVVFEAFSEFLIENYVSVITHYINQTFANLILLTDFMT